MVVQSIEVEQCPLGGGEVGPAIVRHRAPWGMKEGRVYNVVQPLHASEEKRLKATAALRTLLSIRLAEIHAKLRAPVRRILIRCIERLYSCNLSTPFGYLCQRSTHNKIAGVSSRLGEKSRQAMVPLGNETFLRCNRMSPWSLKKYPLDAESYRTSSSLSGCC